MLFSFCLFFAADVPALVVQSRDKTWVDNTAFTRDGRFLASISENDVRIWDVGSGKLLRVLVAPLRPTVVAFTSSGEFLLAAGAQGMNNVWEVRTGKDLGPLDASYGQPKTKYGGLPDTIWALATCADDRAVLRNESGRTDFYDVRQRKKLSGIDLKSIGSLALSADCATLITTNYRFGKPAVWDIRTGKERDELEHDNVQNGRASISADGVWALTHSDTTIFIWNVPKAKLAAKYPTEHHKVRRIVMTPDATRVLSTGIDGKVVVREAATGKVLRKIDASPGELLDLTVSPDSRYLVTAGFKPMHLWELGSGRMLRGFGSTYERPTSISVDASGTRLFMGAMAAPARQWDLLTGTVVKSYVEQTGHAVVALSPDGKTIATGDKSRFHILDAESGAVLHKDSSGGDGIVTMTYGPDGKWLAVGRVKGGSSVSIFDTSTFKTRFQLNTLGDSSFALAASPDGNLLAASSIHNSNDVFVFDVSSGGVKHRLKGHSDWANAVAFSPDSKRIATVERNGSLHFFDAATGAVIRVVAGAGASNSFDHRLAYSYDGKLLALAGQGNGDVHLLDGETGQLVRKLQGHDATSKGVRFTPDDKRIISISNDGTARIWDAATGKQIVALAALGGKTDGVAVLPGGEFSASKGALPHVAFRLGDRAYGFEQFDLRLNRPDLVLQALGASPQLVQAYAKARGKRLKRMGLSEAQVDGGFDVPEVKLITAAPPPTTPVKRHAFRFRISDAKEALDRLNVLANDVPIFGAAGISLKGAASGVEKDVTVELVSGLNRIEVSALNDKGGESLRETIEVTYTGPAAKPDLVVVAIGVSKYKDSRYDLTYAAKDATDFAALMQTRQGTYGQVRVELITDKDATRERILAARRSLDQTKTDDHAVVFMAGHGLLDDKLDYYLATSNINFDQPAKAGVAYHEVEGLLDGIPARKKLLLLDACHSGEVDKSDTVVASAAGGSDGQVKSRGFKVVRKASVELRDTFTLLQNLFADLRRGSGAAVISSASGTEFAFESPTWNNGVFTYSLLEGMKSASADANKDGTVLVSELRDYVTRRVLELTSGKQTPTARRESLEFDFAAY